MKRALPKPRNRDAAHANAPHGEAYTSRPFPQAGGHVSQRGPASALHHLPPHLREVCDMLARGLLRLRSRTAEAFDRDLGGEGESSLHYSGDQSVHVVPLERTSA